MKKIIILTAFLMSFSPIVRASFEDDINVYMIPRHVNEGIIYDSNDKPHKLSSFKGRFLILNFWSRYCAPCLAEMSSLDTYQKFVEDDGIKVILISPEGEWFSSKEHDDFVKKMGIKNLDTYFDKKGEIRRDFGVLKTPHAVIFNSKGEEIGRIKSSQNWKNKDLVEYLYKIKADSNKESEPIMKVGSIKSQELEEPTRK